MLKLYYHCIPSTGTWALQFTKDGPVFLIPDDMINQYPVPLTTDTHVDVEAGKMPIRCINTKYVSYGIDYDSIIYHESSEKFINFMEERNIDTQYLTTTFTDNIHMYIQPTDSNEFVLFDENHNIHAILLDYEVDTLLCHPHIKVQLTKFITESERKIIIHLYSKSKSSNTHDKNYVSLEIGGKMTPLIRMKNTYQFVEMLNVMTYKSYLPMVVETIPDDFDEIDCIEWCKLNTPFYRRIFLDKKHESYVNITPEQLSHLFTISSAAYMCWMFKQTENVDVIGDII